MTQINGRETYHSLRQEILSGRVRVSEIADFYLKEIENRDGEIKSFINVMPLERVREDAACIDEKIKSGKPVGRLAGCVIAVKDNINIKGFATTCGSKILEGYIAPYDATVVKLLQQEDAIIVGKTNLDEFAMGSSTENSAFFTTRNPHDTTRVPGGSSGGSAAAVAAGFAHMALGSDTGGSIRQPAAFCGIVGVKPTYGAVSRYGLVAFASSLDQIGPFARDTRDAALLLDVISAKDPRDSTSIGLPDDKSGEDDLIPLDLKGIKIGLPDEYFISQGGGDRDSVVDEEVSERIEAVVKLLASAGASIKKVSIPGAKYGVATYYIIAPSEASSNLARFDGIKYGLASEIAEETGGLIDFYKKTRAAGFGPEVKRRIMLGTYALSSGYYDAYYLSAQKARAMIAEDFNKAFKEVDFLISPTTTSCAFKIGEKISDPLSMYLSDIFTITANLAGIPAVSIPAGKRGAKSGLPVGVQIMAPHFADRKMLSFAASLEDLLKSNA